MVKIYMFNNKSKKTRKKDNSNSFITCYMNVESPHTSNKNYVLWLRTIKKMFVTMNLTFYLLVKELQDAFEELHEEEKNTTKLMTSFEFRT